MRRELTGWHVLAIFGLGFGTIIAVNLVLATQAVRSFPGLETANSYVASQAFEADRAAQRALNWKVEAEIVEDAVLLRFAGPDETPVQPRALTVDLGRPTSAIEDTALTADWTGTGYALPRPPSAGRWNLRITATAEDGTAFRHVLPLFVKAEK